MEDIRKAMIKILGKDYVEASEASLRESRKRALESLKNGTYKRDSLDEAFYKRAEDAVYKLSFIDFIDTLNIAEDYKKYEAAYMKEVDEIFQGYVEDPDSSDCPDEFSDDCLLSEFGGSISDYVKEIIENITVWGSNVRRYADEGLASIITACVPSLEYLGDSFDGDTYWEFNPGGDNAVADFSRYVDWVKSKIWGWFLEGYLRRNKLTCYDGTVFMDLTENAAEWSTCMMTATDILSRIAFKRALQKENGYFVVGTGSPYERPIMRFMMQNMKDALGFRILYDGDDEFPYEEMSEVEIRGVSYDFGETYEECFTKPIFNLSVNYLKDTEEYFSLVENVGNDSYLFIEKGSEADTDVEGILKLNGRLACLCNKEF